MFKKDYKVSRYTLNCVQRLTPPLGAGGPEPLDTVQ